MSAEEVSNFLEKMSTPSVATRRFSFLLNKPPELSFTGAAYRILAGVSWNSLALHSVLSVRSGTDPNPTEHACSPSFTPTAEFSAGVGWKHGVGCTAEWRNFWRNGSVG